jgi:hypothetical protein
MPKGSLTAGSTGGIEADFAWLLSVFGAPRLIETFGRFVGERGTEITLFA